MVESLFHRLIIVGLVVLRVEIRLQKDSRIKSQHFERTPFLQLLLLLPGALLFAIGVEWHFSMVVVDVQEMIKTRPTVQSKVVCVASKLVSKYSTSNAKCFQAGERVEEWSFTYICKLSKDKLEGGSTYSLTWWPREKTRKLLVLSGLWQNKIGDWRWN